MENNSVDNVRQDGHPQSLPTPSLGEKAMHDSYDSSRLGDHTENTSFIGEAISSGNAAPQGVTHPTKASMNVTHTFLWEYFRNQS